MKKVIAVLSDNHYCLTTFATATKNRWYVAYLVTVVKEEKLTSIAKDEHKLPDVGTVMCGVGGHVYRISEISPSNICAVCYKDGNNRIEKKFYCNKHFKELTCTQPITGTGNIPGRNQPCHCGSGKKYKQCCLANDRHQPRHYFNSRYKTNKLATKKTA